MWKSSIETAKNTATVMPQNFFLYRSQMRPPKRPARTAAREQAQTVNPPSVSRYAAPISPAATPTYGPARRPATMGPRSRTLMYDPSTSIPESVPYTESAPKRSTSRIWILREGLPSRIAGKNRLRVRKNATMMMTPVSWSRMRNESFSIASRMPAKNPRSSAVASG